MPMITDDFDVAIKYLNEIKDDFSDLLKRDKGYRKRKVIMKDILLLADDHFNNKFEQKSSGS